MVLSTETGATNTNWYFGAIKRQEAQNILTEEPEIGTYLIRDSSTCVGDYVLCVKEYTAIRHYIIKRLNGDKIEYKIGEEIFPTIQDIINYYKNNVIDTTCLVKPAQKIKFISEFDFASKDTSDLTFIKGDTLLGLYKTDENWWFASNSDSKTGQVPANYLFPVNTKLNLTPNTTNTSEPKTPSKSLLLNNFHHSSANNEIPIQPNHNVMSYHITTPQNSLLFNGNGHLKNSVYEQRKLPALAIVKYPRNPNAYDKKALTLKVGDMINVMKTPMNGQWEGELRGRYGTFPFTHVQFIGDEKSPKSDSSLLKQKIPDLKAKKIANDKKAIGKDSSNTDSNSSQRSSATSSHSNNSLLLKR